MNAWRPERPMVGVCYYPEQWPQAWWADDARRMHEAGIRLVRIAEFAWSRIEPRPGELRFEWLDLALDTLAAAGLQVVMGTPTNAPPKWLVDRYPDMLALDAQGRPRGFGSRRHYCFSHDGYRAQAVRITEAMAARYGDHDAVVAWQTDNEYGCHDTVESYSAAARAGFRRWLRDRYETIEALNAAWGNVFWSMEYGDFDEVELPSLTVTEANPAHRLDFQRYCSAKVVEFNRAQCEVLRRACPGRALMHNYMGRFGAFDHRATAADLDVAGWDSYPLGFLQRLQEDRPDPARHDRYLRCGDPDFQAFHHDLYRGVGGRLWVVEQQPGPVNWAASNPTPLDGAVRMWGLEAVAHGAEVVSYFRWRQAPFAQEQMHAGLMLPDGPSPAPALAEVAALAGDLAGLDVGEPETAPVALLHDYEAQWFTDIQPQAAGFDYFRLLLDVYRALRRIGADVDVVGPDADLDLYPVIVAPGLSHVGDRLAERLAAHPGRLVLGPRTGARGASFEIPANLPPGPLAALAGIRIERVDSLPPCRTETFAWRGQVHEAWTWREDARALDASPEARCADGLVALWRRDRVRYLAVWPDQAFLRALLGTVLAEAGHTALDLAPGVRTRRRGRLRFFFNYGPVTAPVPSHYASAEFVLGGPDLEPAGVAAVVE